MAATRRRRGDMNEREREREKASPTPTPCREIHTKKDNKMVFGSFIFEPEKHVQKKEKKKDNKFVLESFHNKTIALASLHLSNKIWRQN